MYVIKKTGIDDTVQYVSSIKLSNNRPDIKYQSNPSDAMLLTDIPAAKALAQLAGAAFASTIKIVDFESCLNAADSNVVFAGKQFDEFSVGDIIHWAEIDWKVVKKDPERANVYCMTKSCLGTTPYAKPTYNAKEHCVDTTGTDFRRSNLFTLCKYMHKLLEAEPDFDKLITTQSGFKVGVMTKEMLESTPTDHRSTDYSYWTSSAFSLSDMWVVYGNGYFYSNGYPSAPHGFRPYICVKMSDK